MCFTELARVGVTKLHSQSHSQMVVLWSGYGDSPQTPDNKKLLEMYKVEPFLSFSGTDAQSTCVYKLCSSLNCL